MQSGPGAPQRLYLNDWTPYNIRVIGNVVFIYTSINDWTAYNIQFTMIIVYLATTKFVALKRALTETEKKARQAPRHMDFQGRFGCHPTHLEIYSHACMFQTQHLSDFNQIIANLSALHEPPSQ